MITPNGFGAGFGLPEISPFVTKTSPAQDAGLAYRKQRAMPPASPKGQLPISTMKAEHRRFRPSFARISEQKYGFDFDAGLGQRERAQAWAFERMIEHHVYWGLIGARWVDPDNFAKGPAHFFRRAPEDRREKLREDAQFRVAENYLLSGLGRHAPDDDVDLRRCAHSMRCRSRSETSRSDGRPNLRHRRHAFGALAGILTPSSIQAAVAGEQLENLTAMSTG